MGKVEVESRPPLRQAQGRLFGFAQAQALDCARDDGVWVWEENVVDGRVWAQVNVPEGGHEESQSASLAHSIAKNAMEWGTSALCGHPPSSMEPRCQPPPRESPQCIRRRRARPLCAAA